MKERDVRLELSYCNNSHYFMFARESSSSVTVSKILVAGEPLYFRLLVRDFEPDGFLGQNIHFLVSSLRFLIHLDSSLVGCDLHL